MALAVFVSAFDAPGFFNRGVDFVNQKTGFGFPKMPDKVFNLGLDLQGGAHLVYEADVSSIDSSDAPSAVEGVRDVIERRVNGLGVSEALVQTNKVGDIYRLIVDLPGVSDIKKAISMIGETPILEFKEANDVSQRDLTEEEKKQMTEYNAEAKKKAENALAAVVGGKDFSEAAKEFSENETEKNNGGYINYIGKNSGYADLFEWAKTGTENQISKKVLETADGFSVLKRGKERDGAKEVAASHILICYLGAERCDEPKYNKEEAFAKAQELYTQANAENFAELAKNNSTDTGSKDLGGSLGSFTADTMIKEFSDAAFSAKVGEIVGPVETQFGYHIIYKTGEEVGKEYELWRIFVKKQQAQDILPPADPWKSTKLSGTQLEKSEVVSDPQTGDVQVTLRFNNEGKDLFADITTRNVGKYVAIFLDGEPISIPVVNTPITGGEAVIQGSFDIKEAQLLSQRLNAGALPVPVNLVAQQSVGATLGKVSLEKSLYAGTVGVIAVMLFMLLYYRLPGLLSVFSLGLYIVLTLALFKLVGVTLTLAGIAGFIMSVGMAVDANVLIFERMKEELKNGHSLRVAVEEGFLRAWTSIRDSNLSTLISCALLIWLGTSFVQGFAVTLSIGVLVSMFTAITITRVLLRFIIPWFGERGNLLFLGYKKTEQE